MTQFVPVESSNLAAIGFDPHTEDETLGVLSVRFKSGAVFQYFDVPAEKFDAFMDAPSKGKFYIANVKGAYDHECVEKGDQNTKHRERVKSEIPDANKPKYCQCRDKVIFTAWNKCNVCGLEPKPIIRTGNIDL